LLAVVLVSLFLKLCATEGRFSTDGAVICAILLEMSYIYYCSNWVALVRLRLCFLALLIVLEFRVATGFGTVSLRDLRWCYWWHLLKSVVVVRDCEAVVWFESVEPVLRCSLVLELLKRLV